MEDLSLFVYLEPLWFLTKIIYFIWKVRVRERGVKTQREILYLVVHFSNGYNGQRWTSPKLRVKSFFRVSHVDTGDKNLRHPLLLFHDYQQEVGSGIGAAEGHTSVHMGCQCWQVGD